MCFIKDYGKVSPQIFFEEALVAQKIRLIDIY